MKTSQTIVLACLMMAIAANKEASAVTVLGGLLGSDLTDPNNNAAPADGTTGYDATFASDNEPNHGGGEFSFNVFDNLFLGGGNNKWCCDDPSPGNPANGAGFQLDATILPTGGNPTVSGGYHLSHFTMTSSNDSPDRDPLNWQILGSTDGVNFTTIFNSNGTNYWSAGVRDQTLRFDAGTDFPVQSQGYTTFRYSVTESVGGSAHALGEIEYFGIPEPSSLALFGLGTFGLFAARRRRKS